LADKYLFDNAGTTTEREVTVVSGGAGNAGDAVGLDGGGLLDISVMPSGVGADTVVIAASENLAAGDFVNIWNDTGVIKVRKADATTSGKPPDGFVLAVVTSGNNATVYRSGSNNQLSSLTVGTQYFLTTTAGLASTTAPSASGNAVWVVGKSTSATSISFIPQLICVKA